MDRSERRKLDLEEAAERAWQSRWDRWLIHPTGECPMPYGPAPKLDPWAPFWCECIDDTCAVCVASHPVSFPAAVAGFQKVVSIANRPESPPAGDPRHEEAA